MNKLFLMMSVLLSAGLFCACSNDGDEITCDENGNVITYYNSDTVPSFEPGDVNHLRITREDTGQIDSCWLYSPYCGIIEEPLKASENNGGYHLEFPMVFTAVVKNSSLIDILQFDIHSMVPKKIEDLRVGDTFLAFPLGPGDIYLKTWGGILYDKAPNAVNGIIPWESCKGVTLGGQIQVVDKKTDADGKTYITLSLQDLKFYDYDTTLKNQIYFVLNGLIEFEICEDGLYPKEPQAPDMDKLTTPTYELAYFMIDALYKDAYQGHRTFFSEGPEIVIGSEKQECLLINSEEELRKVYKGDRPLPDPPINFEYCTLVVGHTYGEHGGMSIGGFEFADNGDTWQLNLTVNNNTNPNYVYTCAFIDLYFWKLVPKMENKPVVFNRIKKDVNLDPLGDDTAYAKIRKRWLLSCYTDADGKVHYSSSNMGNENYYIEFKENGKAEGRIGSKTFSCNYAMPYTEKNDVHNYNNDVHNGVINLWNLAATGVDENDPLSKAMMRISDANQFTLYSNIYLDIRISEKELLEFYNADLMWYD